MNTTQGSRTLAEDVLARAAEDWVSAAEVIDTVRRAGIGDPEDLRDLAVGLVARLVAEGYVLPGDIEGSRHHPWSMSEADAILQIARNWASVSDPFVMPGEIFWLDTTEKGEVVGRSVWRREGHVVD